MKKINIFILSLFLFSNICAGIGVYAEHKVEEQGGASRGEVTSPKEEHGAKSIEHGAETKDEGRGTRDGKGHGEESKEHGEGNEAGHEPVTMSHEPSVSGEAVHDPAPHGMQGEGEGHSGGHGLELKGFVTPEISGLAKLPMFAILVPILGAFLVLFAGKKEKLRQGVTVLTAVANFVILLMMVGPVVNGIESGGGLYKGLLFKISYFYTYSLSFKIDPISLLIALATNFLWMMSVIYAIGYMKHEHAKTRYDFFVLLTLAMNLGVLLAGDLLTLFIFFEGLLLAPYPLIIHEENEASKTAAKVYLYMGVATGLCLLMGIFLLNYFTGSLDIAPVGEKLLGLGAWKYIIAGLMIIGFGGKAGLFFEHIWLPKAHPVAPSPASALLSGAMIKAGAYGILRVVNMFYLPVLENASNWLTMNNIGYIMIWVGVLTMFLGVLNALISSNSKQMLAFHSVSQMGYIIMGIGCAAYLGKDGAMGLSGAVYHIINHAIFKASLFMCVGAVYYRTHELDMYKLGGLWRNMPVTAVCLFIAVCGIAGIPGFNGFASKTLLHHSIVEAYEHSVHYLGKPDPMLRLAEVIFMLTAGGTFASNFKLFILTFLGKRRKEHAEVKEVPRPMRIGLIGFSCAILSIGFFPNFILEHMIGPGLSYFGFDPASHPYHWIYNIHATGVHSTIPMLYEPVTKAFFTSREVLHNLGGTGAAVLLGGMYFVLGMRFGWFHVHVPEKLTVIYYYRKVFDGFKDFCMKPCVIFAMCVREFISVLMVYIWVPGSHEGVFIKHPAPKAKGLELFSDADTKFNLVYDENLKQLPGALEMLDRVDSNASDQKRPGAWEVFGRADKNYDNVLDDAIKKQEGMWGVFGRADKNYDNVLGDAIKKQEGMWGVFGRADKNYDNLFGEAIQRQGGIWRMFGKTDMSYETILDRVIAAIIGVEEIPISVIEEKEVLEKMPGEDLVAGYHKFCDANKSVDMNVIDGFVNSLASLTKGLGGKLRELQTGRVSSYAYSFVFGAVVLMTILLFR